MTKFLRNEYLPETVSLPGESLLEVLESKGMSQAELAERTGRPKKTINEIVNGKAAITPETAIQFERVLSVPAEFWNNRERQYREALARRNEIAHFASHADWADRFPCAAMERIGWIKPRRDNAGRVDELLTFFRVASPAAWSDCWREPQAAFRRSPSFQARFAAVAAWLRKGEIEAAQVHAAPFQPDRFREGISSIRSLTRTDDDEFSSKLVDICAASGVVVVFVPELPGTHVWGATRWLGSEKALIQLSLRYKTDDHFWFTFFHEAGHVLLHGKRETFIEADESARDAKKEQEADAFARDTLIPAQSMKAFLRRRVFACTAIRQFGYEIGIAPGVVVGRLQHDGLLPQNHCNELKRRLSWTE